MKRDINDLLEEELISVNDTEIDVSRKELTSLDGIEKFVDLESLDCSNNLLKDLKGIENLISLKTIRCEKNNISTLKPLYKLINLRYLTCQENNLNSLIGLENCKKLQLLNKSKNPFGAKYDEIASTTEELYASLELEKCLIADNDLRGAASISDTGLFDFKINKL